MAREFKRLSTPFITVEYAKEILKVRNAIFIFQDSINRSYNGDTPIRKGSEYALRFGQDTLRTTRMQIGRLRGFDRAFPLTMYNREGNLMNYDDFEEFKPLIEDDVEHIKRGIDKYKPDVIYTDSRGLVSMRQSWLIDSPSTFMFIIEKEIEIYEHLIKLDGKD